MLPFFLSAISFPLDNQVLIFAILLLVIWLAPIVLNHFKIPDLVGLIIAGVLLGPYGFHVMDRDSSIEMFSTIGLLYIMFVAGLEINMADMKKNSLKGITFGLYTFIIPMIMGIVAGIYLLNLSWPTSILLASMFASHTLITYPIVSKYEVTKNRSVLIAVAGTIVTCVLSLLVLAIIVGMTKGELTNRFWFKLTLSSLLFGGIVIFLFPAVCRWFFKWNEDKVSQYLFVLALVFLASFLAQAAGLEAVIGAFLAGLALNSLIPNTSTLMNRIVFVGNALFIPIFLIGVGMLVDLRIFLSDWTTLWVAVVMTVVATLAKLVAAWITQKTFRLTRAEGTLLFGLSNSQAAATLAAVMVGYQVIIGTTPEGEPIRLLNDSILNGTIVMILFTCVIASFVTQKGAQEVALEEMAEEEIVDNEDIKEQILIPLSYPENVEELIMLGVNMRSATGSSSLKALHIIPSEHATPEVVKQSHALLEKAEKIAASMEVEVQGLQRYDDDVVNGIKNVVKEQRITDIVLGLHKERDISDTFLGRLTDKVLAKCAATTLVYKPIQPSATIKRYFVVIPASAEYEMGFPYWIIRIWNIARNLGSKVIFYGAESTLNILKEIRDKHYIEAEYNLLKDWGDLMAISKEVKSDDALFFIMSRRGYQSYNRNMDNVPTYLNKYFSKNNCILLYPIQIGIGEEEVGLLSSIPHVEDRSLDELGSLLKSLFKKNR